MRCCKCGKSSSQLNSVGGIQRNFYNDLNYPKFLCEQCQREWTKYYMKEVQCKIDRGNKSRIAREKAWKRYFEKWLEVMISDWELDRMS